MKKTFVIVAGLLLTGCQKKLIGVSSAPSGSKVYVVMGQSNAYMMELRTHNLLLGSLGAVAVVNCAVERTQMSRWTVGGDLYTSCVNDIKRTLEANPGSYLAGVMFWQGESEPTLDPQHIQLWPSRFRSMIEGLRSTFGASVPLVFAQITDTHTPGRDEVRELQAGFYMPGVAMVTTDDLVQVGDHTTDDGYSLMAGRFIQALQRG